MTRQSLPELQSKAGHSAFLPGFQKEMDRLIDQLIAELANGILKLRIKKPATTKADVRIIDIKKT